MQQILMRMNQTPGIVGSFVVGADGMLVASDVSWVMNEESVGALASAIINTVERASSQIDQGPLKSVAIETDGNKLFFSPTRLGYLVTIATQQANVGLVRLEMENAVDLLNASVAPDQSTQF